MLRQKTEHLILKSIADIRKKSHMASLLYRNGKLTLMKSAGSVDSSGKNLSAFAYAVLKSCDILIVNMVDLCSTENANLFTSLVALTKGLLLRIILIHLENLL